MVPGVTAGDSQRDEPPPPRGSWRTGPPQNTDPLLWRLAHLSAPLHRASSARKSARAQDRQTPAGLCILPSAQPRPFGGESPESPPSQGGKKRKSTARFGSAGVSSLALNFPLWVSRRQPPALPVPKQPSRSPPGQPRHRRPFLRAPGQYLSPRRPFQDEELEGPLKRRRRNARRHRRAPSHGPSAAGGLAGTRRPKPHLRGKVCSQVTLQQSVLQILVPGLGLLLGERLRSSPRRRHFPLSQPRFWRLPPRGACPAVAWTLRQLAARRGRGRVLAAAGAPDPHQGQRRLSAVPRSPERGVPPAAPCGADHSTRLRVGSCAGRAERGLSPSRGEELSSGTTRGKVVGKRAEKVPEKHKRWVLPHQSRSQSGGAPGGSHQHPPDLRGVVTGGDDPEKTRHPSPSER